MTPRAPKSVYTAKPVPVPVLPPAVLAERRRQQLEAQRKAPKAPPKTYTSTPTDIPTALAHAKAVRAAKAPPPVPPKPKGTSRTGGGRVNSIKAAVASAAKTKPVKPKKQKPRDNDSYDYDNAKPAPRATMSMLAEAMFALDADTVMAYKPRTVGEMAVRTAWIKAIAGDNRALSMLWDKCFVNAGTANPLAEMLAAIGKAAAIKPTTPITNETDED